MLRHLVESFDCDEGQDKRIFSNTTGLLSTMLGAFAAECFREFVIENNTRRFSIENITSDELWHKILDCAY